MEGAGHKPLQHIKFIWNFDVWIVFPEWFKASFQWCNMIWGYLLRNSIFLRRWGIEFLAQSRCKGNGALEILKWKRWGIPALKRTGGKPWYRSLLSYIIYIWICKQFKLFGFSCWLSNQKYNYDFTIYFLKQMLKYLMVSSYLSFLQYSKPRL